VSQFEYVAIPVSLIMTFAIARLLSGFPYLLAARRTYWVHTLWCSTAMLNVLVFWWAFWNASDFEDWTLGSYLMTLFYPAMCYVGATVLMPTHAAADTDWHDYYFSVRKLIFSIAAIATAANLGTIVVFGAIQLASPAGLVSAVFIGLYVVGFFIDSERAQGGIVLVNATLVVAVYAPLVYEPLAL
jgi:hypothetical protein